MTNTIKPIPGLDIYVTMVAVPHDGKTDYYFFASDQNKDWTVAEVRAIQTKAASTDARVTQMAGPYPTPRAAYAAAKALLTDGVTVNFGAARAEDLQRPIAGHLHWCAIHKDETCDCHQPIIVKETTQ